MDHASPVEDHLPPMSIPRYDRLHEQPAESTVADPAPFSELESLLGASTLLPGSKDLARAVLRYAEPRIFGGGGLGLEYGPLLKTATRPDLLRTHIAEVAAHLHQARVDLLVVPGMSGYPIGAMYSQASGIPAVLLKKQTHREVSMESPPPGAFLIPSYTGDGDTLISADMAAVRAMLDPIIARQLQSAESNPTIEIRIAGADEIIDKATMATAITETAPIFCRAAAESLLAGRAADLRITFVAWVTPLIKAYNRSQTVLSERFGIEPFAGLALTSLQIDPPAAGIAGLGTIAFAPGESTT